MEGPLSSVIITDDIARSGGCHAPATLTFACSSGQVIYFFVGPYPCAHDVFIWLPLEYVTWFWLPHCAACFLHVSFRSLFFDFSRWAYRLLFSHFSWSFLFGLTRLSFFQIEITPYNTKPTVILNEKMSHSYYKQSHNYYTEFYKLMSAIS